MKKPLVVICFILVFCMSFTMVAFGGDDYEMPKIPLTNSSSTSSESTSGGEVVIDEPDFDALNVLLSRTALLNEEDFSEESFEMLTTARNNGQSLIGKAALQTVIDFAVCDILTAVSDLVPYIQVSVVSLHGDVTINSESVSKTRVLRETYIALDVTADDGYEFVGWYDADTKRLLSTNAQYSFMPSSNISVMAKFRRADTASLTFESASGQVVKTYEKTADAWAKVSDIESLLPDVPFSYGKANGTWDYDNAEVVSALAAGESVVITPSYDLCEADLPEIPSENETPTATLNYVLDEDNNVASFLLAVKLPADCEVEEIGTALYYKNADEFNPADYELVITDKVLTSKFTETEDGVYVTNINKFSSRYNWAVRGYITYRDRKGNLKTVYSNQINIVDRQIV